MHHLQTPFLFTICLLLSTPVFPQEPTPDAERAMAGIRPHAIRAHMRFLADDPPRRSVLFLAVTAEELGLQGSDYFARNPTVPIDRIVANVNMDMFLMLYPLKDVVGYGTEHSSLGPALEKAAGRLGITVSPDPIPDEVFFIRSDQYSFIQRGIPAVALASGEQTTNPAIDTAAVSTQWRREKYHRPGDDMSQPIDFDSGMRFTQLNFLLTWRVAQDDKAPSWNPGDFFGEKFARQAGTAGDGQ